MLLPPGLKPADRCGTGQLRRAGRLPVSLPEQRGWGPAVPREARGAVSRAGGRARFPGPPAGRDRRGCGRFCPSQRGHCPPLAGGAPRSGRAASRSRKILPSSPKSQSEEGHGRAGGRGRGKSPFPGRARPAPAAGEPRAELPGRAVRTAHPAPNPTKSIKSNSSHSALPFPPHTHALYLFLCRVFNKFLPKGAMIPAA